jgi:biopolymer transport protein ExbB
MIGVRRGWMIALVCFALGSAGAALAQAAAAAPQAKPKPPEPKPKSMAELLDRVRIGSKQEREENKQREAEFRAAKSEQTRLLESARARRAAAEAHSEELEAIFEEKEKVLPELQETLRLRLGTLGELFGVVRQASGDTAGLIDSSLVSTQIKGRTKFLERLAQSKELPSIVDLEKLWFTILQEMSETGKIARYDATVVELSGNEATRTVTRVGPFNALAGGEYLTRDKDTGKLKDLGRQPLARHLSTVKAFEAATSGLNPISIDPSQGAILSMLVQNPTLDERVQQGGLVGYIIIALGMVGVLMALYRLFYLGVVGNKIKAQRKRDAADDGNPLGRILSVYDSNKKADVETLELKLDEAILRETPRLEAGNAMIRVLSVVAPLLGLLGTVTGMIQVFQQIQLYGTGDPKLMAGGISMALVTTVLGLVMAIPLVLLHSVISGRSKSLIQILEEQSAGIIARHAEQGGGGAAAH